jgi:hypothetical protein
MGLTLAQARDIVEDFLDDNTNSRWSVAQIDTALGYALNSCLNDYLAGGGERLHEIVNVSTDALGKADLSSYNPNFIAGITLSVGNREFRIPEVSWEERGLNDSQIRPLSIRLLRTFSIPSTTSHPLVGVGATGAKTWPAFEHWVCIRAALFCSTKDAEDRADLQRLESEARDNALVLPAIPKAVPFASKPHWYSVWFSWAWDPASQTIQICRKGWF